MGGNTKVAHLEDKQYKERSDCDSVRFSCCRRKPKECDACENDDSGINVCANLMHPPSYNHCPPRHGSLLHHQSKLQRECCTMDGPNPWQNPSCVRTPPGPEECDLSTPADVIV
eukprot:gnl/MRDRNA2_/MRDRNA2_428829_c0_seq1.p2 gnl/MRDRNA2_/MRDRNA2_428829_c0~~gnl/MRDRNA2_/MRDRNA2_428829_c0_seq1.p2  ORF type:complete len:114 (-),score=13.58 gnl/MRDRNA2_/MRDRNA2_428829_c0_seq1:24-365(-)